MAIIHGVDQSNNNRNVDLDEYAWAGHALYAHKATEGRAWHDPLFPERWRRARELRFGYRAPYAVIRRGSGSGVEQAQGLIEYVESVDGPLQQGEFVQLDWEGWSDGFASAQQAREFIDTVSDHVGRWCVIPYYGLPNPYRNDPLTAGVPMWLADYRSAAPGLNPLFGRAAIWQFAGANLTYPGCLNAIQRFDVLDLACGYSALSVPDPNVGGNLIIHPRSEWVNPGTWQRHDPVEPDLIGTIAAHYTGGNQDVDEDPREFLRRTDAQWLQRKPSGYNIGYSWMIDWQGEAWEIRGLTDRCAANGTVDANRRNLAILFLTPTPADVANDVQIRTARQLTARAQDQCPNLFRWSGHHDWFQTDCPGPIYEQAVSGLFMPQPDVPVLIPVEPTQGGVVSPLPTEDDVTKEEMIQLLDSDQGRGLIQKAVNDGVINVLRGEEFQNVIMLPLIERALSSLSVPLSPAVEGGAPVPTHFTGTVDLHAS